MHHDKGSSPSFLFSFSPPSLSPLSPPFVLGASSLEKHIKPKPTRRDGGGGGERQSLGGYNAAKFISEIGGRVLVESLSRCSLPMSQNDMKGRARKV